MPLAKQHRLAAPHLRPEGCARPAARARRARDRPDRLLPRPDPRAGLVEGRPPKRGRAERRTAAPTRATAASPTSRAPPCSSYNIDARHRRGRARRRRDPLRLRAAPGRPALLDALPGTAGHAGGRRSSASCARAGRRSPARTRSSVRRCSASPRRGPRRSPRTSRRWRERSTTSRRCSTPPIGGRASTASRTRTGSPYAIVRALDEGLRSAGARLRRTDRQLAPGLLLRPRLLLDGGARADQGLPRRGRGRLHPLGRRRRVHARTLSMRRPRCPRSALSTSPPKDAPRPVRLADRKAPAAGAAAPTSDGESRTSAAAGPAAERARPHPGGDAPHDPAGPGRRVRPDAGGVPRRARLSLATRLHARSTSATSSAASWTCPPARPRSRSRSTTRPPISSTSRRTATVKPDDRGRNHARLRTAPPRLRPRRHLLRQPHAIRQRHERRSARCRWLTRTRIRGRQPHARSHPAADAGRRRGAASRSPPAPR